MLVKSSKLMRDAGACRYWFGPNTYGRGWGLPGAVTLASTVLILICWRTGVPSKWRWGDQ